VNSRLLPPLIALLAFVIRFLSVGAIENDHYVYLARAHQILHGDWPVRDFDDPGAPLGYLLSAAAAALTGPTLLTEVVLSAALFAVAAGVTFALVRRGSGSMAVALMAVVLVLVFPPRLYNSSKVLVPIVATALAWRYADTPSRRAAAALGAWTGVAFLFRHDYAAYVGFATLLLLVVRHWREWKHLTTAVVTYSLVAAAVATPWLLYVELQQGLGDYFAAAVRFSAAERHRTVSSWPFAYYAAAAVPVAALIAGIRGTRHLTTAQVVFASALVLSSEAVLLRDAPGARLPDVVATTTVVAAIVIGRLIPERIRRPQATPPILLTAGIITAVGLVLIVARSSIAAAVPQVLGRWQTVTTRLRDVRPEIMPDPGRAGLVRFIERCAAPDERVLIGGFGPELPVLAHRAFAGGLPDWIRGYYEDAQDVTRARTRLAHEDVALAVMLDGGDAFAHSWPGLADDLRARGLTRYDLRLRSGPVEVWLRPAGALDAATSLPCAR
jgi:4-amino-4-deoxy-L-arabinose transferase-like glycosyltransferase